MSFPTPMEEPRKIIRCHYLGSREVNRPTGMDIINEAVDSMYYRVAPEKWMFVSVGIAPSTITITEHGVSDFDFLYSISHIFTMIWKKWKMVLYFIC